MAPAAPPAVVVSGPPGAGKTSVARLVAARFAPVACLLETDWWWSTLATGLVLPWDPAAGPQNHDRFRAYTAAAAAKVAAGYPVVLDGVVGPWLLDPLRHGLRRAGALHYIVLRPSLAATLERSAARTGADRLPGQPALTDPKVLAALWGQFRDLGKLEGHALDTTALDPVQSADRVWAAVASGSHRLAGG